MRTSNPLKVLRTFFGREHALFRLIMLSALALSGPVAQVIPSSPPSTADTSQSVQRESFQDVYRNVPTDDRPNDTESKPKTSSSNITRTKKNSSDDQNDKTAIAAAPSASEFLLKAPIAFTLSFLGMPTGPDEKAANGQTGKNELQPAAQASSQTLGNGSTVAGMPPSLVVPVNERLAFSARLTPNDASTSQLQAAGTAASVSADDLNSAPLPAGQSQGNNSALSQIASLKLPIATPAQIANAALTPANEKLASSTLTANSSASQAQASQTSASGQTRAQSSEAARDTTEPAAAPASSKDQYQTADVKKSATPEAVAPVREISSGSAVDIRSTPSQPQGPQPASPPSTRSLAVQDVQPVLPEAPKPPASSEILLQLAGQNQSTVSVRVMDRSGMVNVSVHAADADLRNSLRSNLSDLASQLTGQGYKTELVKPAVIAANTDNHHGSRQSGRDSSGQQQQSAQDSRQPQRDRRANSERWRDELEQGTSSATGAPGGRS
jgi:hypothetical protein